MLALSARDGWTREAAEIRATLEAVTTTQPAFLAYGSELRAAETNQGTWRPTWMGGTPEPAHA
jgi:hypothetical protein